jgi:5'-nucleotidase
VSTLLASPPGTRMIVENDPLEGWNSSPWSEIKGIELTRLGHRVYHDKLITREDPRGRPYYWIGGLPPKGVAEHGTDIWALENNLISITPLNLDMTSHRMLDELKRWKLEEIIL